MKTDLTLSTISKEDFDALPKRKQRILLAHDVLAQLKTEKYVEQRGTYFSFKTNDIEKFQEKSELSPKDVKIGSGGRLYFPNRAEVSAQNVIEHADTCYVCAKGALVCSYVRRFNQRSLGMIGGNDDPDLVKIFGFQTWAVIERAFEGWGVLKTSMESLMQNIIDNEGVLILDGYRYDGEDIEYIGATEVVDL